MFLVCCYSERGASACRPLYVALERDEILLHGAEIGEGGRESGKQMKDACSG